MAHRQVPCTLSPTLLTRAARLHLPSLSSAGSPVAAQPTGAAPLSSTICTAQSLPRLTSFAPIGFGHDDDGDAASAAGCYSLRLRVASVRACVRCSQPSGAAVRDCAGDKERRNDGARRRNVFSWLPAAGVCRSEAASRSVWRATASRSSGSSGWGRAAGSGRRSVAKSRCFGVCKAQNFLGGARACRRSRDNLYTRGRARKKGHFFTAFWRLKPCADARRARVRIK